MKQISSGTLPLEGNLRVQNVNVNLDPPQKSELVPAQAPDLDMDRALDAPNGLLRVQHDVKSSSWLCRTTQPGPAGSATDNSP
ncbi:predicted protein [Pyrenophora tritici-repentis Pt-1C-BFP]|uniref:Uncharacterized protein n=1 Tax=Pyrenophora tritici-repentis (strain Pt-1C-BFP) TaxID=426418 RepID=B2WD05_PYRTR|nr:uncharacterized protein PTRG_07864 [Pyrenophora tritici-repentis Pt-1C-BFP]EDU50783.1 predicted protein [Pyrenophora tritici-repentis Pt-1C-BFP]